MKLLTYNFLTSKCIKGVKVGFPLKLTANKTEVQETDFNSEFMSRILTRVDWPTVRLAAEYVGCPNDLPAELTDAITEDQTFLEKVHHILMEIDVIEGALECPETGRIFPIAEGIPNMLLNEGEV